MWQYVLSGQLSLSELWSMNRVQNWSVVISVLNFATGAVIACLLLLGPIRLLSPKPGRFGRLFQLWLAAKQRELRDAAHDAGDEPASP